MSALDDLIRKVEASPLDWDLRLQAVEALAARREWDRARLLVKNSPDGPVPYHIQKRLWDALSGDTAIEVVEKPGGEGGKPELIVKAKILSGKAEKETTSPRAESKAPALARIACLSSSEESKPLRLAELRGQRKKVEPVSGLQVAAVTAAGTPKARPPVTASQTMSSLTLAILAHLALLLFGGLVILHLPESRPPDLIAVPATTEEITDVLMKRSLVRNVENSTPAAASQALANVLTVDSSSSLRAPRFDQISNNVDINLVDSGIGMSQGLSLDGKGVESTVTFFGVQGGGRRIAFIIDATPYMLLDEKGGMVAYDKVKQEIAAMLNLLNRGTAFNIIVFQGKRLSMFRDQPVRAYPSTVSRAIEWLDPLNRTYEALGIRDAYTDQGIKPGAQPIAAGDIAHYSKAIQAAMEQQANAIFCITAGWQPMNRALSPEDQKKLEEAQAKRREMMKDIKVTYDPKEVEAWRQAQERAREWLRKENEARKEKGLPPKVVIDFNELVLKVTPGARPPKPQKSEEPPPLEVDVKRLPPYTPEDVEKHIDNVATANFGKNKPDRPQVHMVLFLGKDEDIGQYEDHFKRLARHNQGELKILRGLAALENVTKLGS